MSRIKKSIALLISRAGIRINNSLSNEDVKAAVAEKGYTEEKLLEGRTLIVTAEKLVQDQQSLEGAAKKATETEAVCKKLAHKAYQDLAKIIRAKFKAGSPELTTVGLTGRQPRAIADFVKAANTLFDNALSTPSIADAIAKNKYTPELIATEKAKIAAYEKANSDQTTAIGAALKATEDQNAAIKALSTWLSEYTTVAKIALSSDKKLLEKIGIFTGKRSKPKRNDKDNPEE